MKYTSNRLSTTPINVQRSKRMHDLRVLTSLPAGKMVPLAAIPLLREDSIGTSRFQLSFEMMETVELLMNAVHINVKAYLVPNLAFERFDGMDALNRSYEGVARDGDEVVPYFETIEANVLSSDIAVLKYMGKHYKGGTRINTAYIEAYNAIWNMRAKNRSLDITLRDRLNTQLAPAFWQHTQFAHIVPDFDAAVIDGEVALNVVNARMPVRGIAVPSKANPAVGIRTGYDSNSETGVSYTNGRNIGTGTGNEQDLSFFTMRMKPGSVSGEYFPDIYAELQDNGITVSLSNIEMARKTQAFAKMREAYNGHSDEYLIDLLMDGITIPEQQWRNPILLADKHTQFGMAKRYATDGGNLTDSVVSGATNLEFGITVPKVPCGGVVMIIAEITPEQLFERQQDHYLHISTVDELPQFVRDTLDPQKVEVVRNDYIDVDHDQPANTFGYAPLNHKWTSHGPNIGGRFYRPEVDAPFDEDRQRIWAVENKDPVLSEDFYLCTTMHTKPFVVTNQDPFEVVMRGGAVIHGLTVLGPVLVEEQGNYDAIAAEAPTDRIEK